MAKKKIISKQQKPAKVQKQQKEPEVVVQKKSRKSHKQQSSTSFFTPQFYDKLNDFQSFYRQVLQLKSSQSKSDLDTQLNDVNKKVRQELQVSSSKILRNELVDLEKWIQEQQQRLRGQIENIRTCYEQNQKALQSTKAFTVDEITNNLRPIQSKIEQKQRSLDNYGNLLARSKGIYGQGQQNQVHENEEAMNLD